MTPRPWPIEVREERRQLRARYFEIEEIFRKAGIISMGAYDPMQLDEEDFVPVSDAPPARRTGAGSRIDSAKPLKAD